MNKCHLNTELSSLEGTRSEFNRSTAAIKLGIDVHQDFYVVVKQEGGTHPKPAQRFQKEAFLHWVAKLTKEGAEMHAVYEACGIGFELQRQLTALGIHCYVVCPQKLDERNKRVKTDGVDAKALCLKLDRFVEGNRDALALVRVPLSGNGAVGFIDWLGLAMEQRGNVEPKDYLPNKEHDSHYRMRANAP